MEEHARHYTTRKYDAKNTFQMTMECASIFMENSESSPHCVSFKFKHFLSSEQSSLELSCFYYFFLLECAFLILNVHNTKQGPYLQHKCTTGHRLCTVRHSDCWQGCLIWSIAVLFRLCGKVENTNIVESYFCEGVSFSSDKSIILVTLVMFNLRNVLILWFHQYIHTFYKQE